MGEMDGAVAIAEPIESTGADEVIENQGSSVSEGTEPVAEVDSSPEKQELTQKTGQKIKVDLATVAKTQADALKAIDPALPAALRTAAFELGGFFKEFPGGLKEARALKASISEFGGMEGIQETQQTVSEFGALAQAFFDGKPDFVDNLIKESPQAFSQMMPDGLAKWKQVDPDGYGHNLAKVATATLDSIYVSKSLEAVWSKLADGPEKDEIARIWNGLNDLRKLGEQAPERKVDPKMEALTRKEQELAEKEQTLAMKPVTAAGRAQVAELLDREMNASYKWAETDSSVKDAVKDKVESELVRILRTDKGYQAQRDRLKERGDYDGLTRHIKETQARLLPTIVQRVAKLFAVKPKGAGPVAVKKPVAATPGAKVDPAFVRVPVRPSPSQIDYRAMGPKAEDMIWANKAILKDGRHVQWA